ncbi:hypothetical protein TNIN_375341 [Trichonephila inaurata madagascariensis]|uniref:Uncharacterized protein n=1 Tax=Trichonephila inaurata madagascariensis TaxID=2747483 RepID=A0A8X6WQJ8_9ARAC|nr:hypothetical protein TNIN_375341 [Trichonephila inaurata madagascariensis]
MDTSTESETSSRSRSPLALPPWRDDLQMNYEKAHHSSEHLHFNVIIEKIIQDIDNYTFRTATEKNEFFHNAQLFRDKVRSGYATVKNAEVEADIECRDIQLRQWGIPIPDEIAQFTPVFEALTVEDPPTDEQGNFVADDTEIPSRTSTPVQYVRPPPLITIDNIAQPAQLLKRIQHLTQQKLVGRMKVKSMRLYPETPSAYNQIRKLIETKKLEAFTFQFPEEKEYRVVIRGMPSDMPGRYSRRIRGNGNPSQGMQGPNQQENWPAYAPIFSLS